MSESRKQLQQLLAQKDALELEAEAIHSELTSPGPNGEPPAGIRETLIDADGFPRGEFVFSITLPLYSNIPFHTTSYRRY